MTRTHRFLLLSLLAVVLAAACLAGVRTWRGKAALRQEQLALARVEQLIKDGQPREALPLVGTFVNTSANAAWQRLELEALTAAGDLPHLAQVFERTPGRVLADERASVLMARAFLHSRKSAEFGRVREGWRGREVQRDAWLALDSDALALAGKANEARALLRSSVLPGAMDATRLTRLALLSAKTDLPGAWTMLAQAAALQPRNPDVRSFRGQILETARKMELARVEYVAALVASPESPFLRDQLAAFYVRRQNLDLALDTWAEGLSRSTPDFIWLKAHFWSRVLRPATLPGPDQLRSGDLEPLVRQVATLPEGRFFDAPAFEALPGARSIAAQQQEVFWLRLLDALQDGREADAQEQLQFERGQLRSWDPDLATALARILSFRRKHSLNPPDLAFTSPQAETNRPPLFVALEKAAREERAVGARGAALPPELAALLASPHAYSAALLAAGWREAAIRLRPNARLTPDDPEWVSRGFAQALRINRGPKAALDFLGSTDLPPATALLRAELLAEVGRREPARRELQRLAGLDSGVGFRASLLLALDAAEQKQFETARLWISRHPLLAQDQVGKELLARLALAEGRTGEAELIYRSIAERSIDAKAWYAQQAFSSRRWDEARRWTGELLELMPDSTQIRENLLAIDQAQQGRP